MAENTRNQIPCPFRDKIKPKLGPGGRVMSQEDSRAEGIKHRPSDADIYGSVAGKRGGGRGGSSGTIMSKDKRRDGKDFNKTARQAAEERHEISSGETHLKASPKEDSSSIVIGEKGILIMGDYGTNAIGVDSENGVTMQGKVTVNNYGTGITKAWFSENPLSFLSSTIYTQIPGLLFKMPDLGLFQGGLLEQLKGFMNIFYKG